MNKPVLFTLLLVVTGNVMAIDPVFEGENGILKQIFEPKCLVCHSSTLSGSDRNDAPFKHNFDTYASALSSGDDAVQHTSVLMDMPPSFNGIRKLTDEEKQAMLNWQQLDFPEKDLPPIFSESESALSISTVYVMDSAGNITSTKVSTKMNLISSQAPFRFEISELNVIEDTE